MIESIISTILTSLWLILPAYFANSSPVIFGGGKPIDHGLRINGKRLFGDGKTYRGTAAGICCGILAGLLQNYIGASINAPSFPLSVLILISTGALFGDLVESLIKRRLGIEQGSFFFPFDQLDFVLGVYLFLWLFAHEWFLQHFTPMIIITLIIITPLLHVLSNVFGYLAGKKDVPW
ncbi:CDP-2,3-bis-(O-geranylgeranyl)-sn-glycerol synthase [Methanosarcinales archaeon]|nr:MAG: CDP-2,3-bis-(O-geranylgeranyl)-sn-glycerol synthase [Methanosarcinales archaeon]